MILATIKVSKTNAKVKEVSPITAGLVGATVEVEFDSTWKDYDKVYVWSGNNKVITDITASGVIPPEVVANQKSELKFGVYGVKDGNATPTVWANLGFVRPGADPNGDESADPSLPVWAQIQERLEDILSPEEVLEIIRGYLDDNPEVDPTVPEWAKHSQKPQYTADEVGAQPKGNYLTEIPAGYATEEFVRNRIAELVLGGGSGVRVSEITLSAEKWEGAAPMFYQVIEIDGITENSQVDPTPSAEQLMVLREKDVTIVIENEDGVVTVYAIGQKLTNDYTLQVTITEVD